jgi:hypothetical protein
MPNSALKVVFGAIIPGLVTWIFNLLNFVFDHMGTLSTAMATIPASTFDIAVGNATAILGSCLATKDQNTLRAIAAAFVFVLVGTVFCELLAPVMFQWKSAYCVGAMDVLSVVVLVWVLVRV